VNRHKGGNASRDQRPNVTSSRKVKAKQNSENRKKIEKDKTH